MWVNSGGGRGPLRSVCRIASANIILLRLDGLGAETVSERLRGLDQAVLDSTLPPEILLLGARQSQEVKCLASGQAERSVPHSPTSLSAR